MKSIKCFLNIHEWVNTKFEKLYDILRSTKRICADCLMEQIASYEYSSIYCKPKWHTVKVGESKSETLERKYNELLGR